MFKKLFIVTLILSLSPAAFSEKPFIKQVEKDIQAHNKGPQISDDEAHPAYQGNPDLAPMPFYDVNGAVEGAMRANGVGIGQHQQTKVISIALFLAGLSKGDERIKVAGVDELMKELLENQGFQDITRHFNFESRSESINSLMELPAGAIVEITSRDGRNKGVYIKGNDGNYYSQGDNFYLPRVLVRNEYSVTKVVYKKAGSGLSENAAQELLDKRKALLLDNGPDNI